MLGSGLYLFGKTTRYFLGEDVEYKIKAPPQEMDFFANTMNGIFRRTFLFWLPKLPGKLIELQAVPGVWGFSLFALLSRQVLE